MALSLLLDRSGAAGDALPSAARFLAGAALAALAAACPAARRRPRPARSPPLASSPPACWPTSSLAHHDLHATAPPSLLASGAAGPVGRLIAATTPVPTSTST